MKVSVKALLGAVALAGFSLPAYADTTLTIATVNNGDMITMQQLTDDFTKANPDIKVNWVTLEENDLRQKVTKDISTKGGQFDITTIGTYETPIWGKKGWLLPLNSVDAPDDLLPAMRAALSVDGKLYASPFYGESSFTMYRKDLFEKAGLKMPEAPTWEFIADAARKLTDRSAGINGICLRGKAGWGENMAFLDSTANALGARWFDEKWNPQFDTPEWKKTLTLYLDLMKDAGPPGASGNGFSENLALFQSGKCAMWIDATSAGAHVADEHEAPKVFDKVGFALAPSAGLGKGGNWLWAWALGIPAGTKHAAEAEKFINWATSKHYIDYVAAQKGWVAAPPGTRASLYANPEYQKAAPFAKATLELDQLGRPEPSDGEASALYGRAVRRDP